MARRRAAARVGPLYPEDGPPGGGVAGREDGSSRGRLQLLSTMAWQAMIRKRSATSDVPGKICVIRIPTSSSAGSIQKLVPKKPLP